MTRLIKLTLLIILMGSIIIIVNQYKSQHIEKVFVFNSAKSCQKFNIQHNNNSIDCEKLEAYSKILAKKFTWNFPDGATCVQYYGLHSCEPVKIGSIEYRLKPVGFLYSYHKEDANYLSLPVYYSMPLGKYLTPNSYPIKIGYNEIGRFKTGYLNNLSIPKSLNSIGCFYRKSGKRSIFECGTRDAILKKAINHKAYYTNGILMEKVNNMTHSTKVDFY
jgi:hypothetical protein